MSDEIPPWEKARDEVLDEMKREEVNWWAAVQMAVDKVVKRWRAHEEQ